MITWDRIWSRGRRLLPQLSVALAAFAVLFLLLAVCKAGAAVGEGGNCASAHMFVVAHEDDTLLFQSPSILEDIESGRCTRSVFITAGDDGKGEVYWHSREEGVEAAYAQMAGVEDEWTSSTIVADAHSLLMRTLVGEPRVTVVFMRLPDGNYPAGTGFPAYGNQSLMKLWNGGNGGSPSETSITAVDKSNTFSYSELVATLTALMRSYEPQEIATQDYTETFSGWDHHDHTATAYFTRLAQRSYTQPHQLVGFEDYPTLERPQNLAGPLLEEKMSVFYLYGLYDEGACSEEIACEATEYNTWLKREYVAAEETTGVVANAGYAQTVKPGEAVHLDGSESSAQGGSLAYKWTQTGGPTVSLGGTETAKPTFVAPSSGELTFILSVRNGVTWSAADSVRVAVEAAKAEPVAVAGAPQSVSSGATVQLDGSGSYDPEGRALTYSWTQTAGPSVTLSSPTVAKPTFTAPAGAASLTFSLTVTAGGQSSQASTVAVEVAAAVGTSNVAPLATATASSSAPEQGAEKAIDGVISGYPEDPYAEWSSNGQKAGAWLTLKWAKAYTLDHVVLYDRPNTDDQITAGTLTFSDGSTVSFGALPNEGKSGLMVSFSPRATTSLKITATSVSSTTLNIGLSEVEAWGTGAPEAPQAIKPSITSVSAAGFTTGSSGSFTVTTTGNPTATLKSSGTLPSGLTFVSNGDGTATIAGTPAASAAPAGSSKTYSLIFTATNSAGSTTQSFTLTVVNNEPKPTKPAFTTPSSRTATVNKAIEIPIEASGVPTPTLALSGSAPKGMTFKVSAPGAAVLSGTPTTTGTSRLTIAATNSVGKTTQTLTLTVSR